MQILRSDDLQLPEAVKKELSTRSFAAEFIEGEDRSAYLKLYGTHHFMLTQVVPLLKNIGLDIHSEISYVVEDEKREVFVSRYKIGNERASEIKKAEKNVLDLIRMMLCDPVLPNTPLLQMTLLENT